MARRSERRLDLRVLTHHPAGPACLAACEANGWQPRSADVVRLVRLWDEVRRGQRNEVPLSRRHLAFARWLVQHGRIGEHPPAGSA